MNHQLFNDIIENWQSFELIPKKQNFVMINGPLIQIGTNLEFSVN